MSYKVLPYSFEDLKDCFYSQASTQQSLIDRKQHLTFFKNYFQHINTQTIVIEDHYIDRDFLEDYSSYYVRSFKDYKRMCKRLHFFDISFTEESFDKRLKGEQDGVSEEQLQAAYQGFIVLKPLPYTIIGKTCLKTYPEETRRYFPSIRQYKANLFGICLTIDSIAYQEQDSIVAACASSAVWTAFHGTGILFQHSLPSPVEITKWATRHFPFANRHFPNKGLTAEQMAIAIREINLEPYLYNVSSYDTLKATIYAYLKGRIPIILGVGLWEANNNSSSSPARNLGGHAVTITGYSLGGPISNTFEQIGSFSLVSSKIDKLYVHDDQVGPFAKMEFNNTNIYVDSSYQIKCLDTTWVDGNGNEGNIKASSDLVIIPLYHKIRIPFEHVLGPINTFNNFLLVIKKQIPAFQVFHWDIFLSDISDIKSDIISSNLSGEYKRSLLIEKFPKYLWRVLGLIGQDKKIELVFDATDIDQGSFFLRNIIYDQTSVQFIEILAEQIDQNVLDSLKPTEKAIIESFKRPVSP